MNDRPSRQLADLDIDLARRIDAVCRRFEADWRAGQKPRIQDYQDDVPDEGRAALQAELAALEEELRHGDESVARLMDITADLPPRPQAPAPSTVAESPTLLPQPPPTVPVPPEAMSSVHEDPTIAPTKECTIDLDPCEPSSGSQPSRTVIRYFGDYEIIREIARGGMGVVFQARQMALNRPVALKMILAGQLADEIDIRRFYMEAEAAANLDHPGIVPIYEVGEHEGQHYFSMGFVEGESLAHKVAAGPLPPREAAKLLAQIADSIQYAHDRGVIHRDLKPANVLLDARGQPKVTDFGLAKKLAGDSGLTASGQVMGTPSYMPPEQAAGQHDQIGPLADVYSLGAMLYCLLTGRPPFQSASAMDTLLQVLELEPVPLRRLNLGVPRDLETICVKCLEKSPARRYSSASALALDLRRYLAGEPIAARPVGQMERGWRWCRRNPVVASLLAALFVVLAGAAGGASWAAVRFRDQAAREKRIADSEKRARKQADDANGTAQEQRAIAVAKSAESLQRLSNQLVSNGNLPRAQGDWLACLPWYADALAIDAGEPERQALHRMRVAGTLRRIPRLVHLTWMPLEAGETVSFAPDGLRLLGPADRKVVALDPLSGKRIESRLALPDPPGRLRISPDGRVAVRLLERPGTKPKESVTELLAWDVAANRALGPPITIGAAEVKLAFRPTHRRLATWGSAHPLQFWDLDSGREIEPPVYHELKNHLLEAERRIVLDIQAAPEVDINQKFRLQMAAGLGITGRETAPVSSSRLAIRNVIYSADGRLIAVSVLMSNPLIAPSISLVQVFDAETGLPRTPALVHRTYIGEVAFSSDGSTLATLTQEPGGRPREAQVFSTATGKSVLGPLNHGDNQGGSIFAVAFNPDGRRLVTAGSAEARIWDIAKARSLDRAAPLSGKIVAVAFSPDGHSLATLSGREGVARVWDAATLEPLTPPLRQAGITSSLRFSPAGRLLVTVGNSTAPHELEARAWDLTGPTPGEGRSQPGRWYTPDGRFVLGAESKTTRARGKTTHDVSLKLIDRASGKPAAPLVSSEMGFVSVWQAALSADGRRLVAVMLSDHSLPNNRTVRTWNFHTSPPAIADLKHSQPVVFVALAPDGRYAATVAGSDHFHPCAVWLWDLSTNQGKPLAIDPNRNTLLVEFSADGRRLLSVQDGLAQLWDTASAKAIGPPVKSARAPDQTATRINWVSGRHMQPWGTFAAGGRIVLVSVGDAAVHRIDAETGLAQPGGPIPAREAVEAIAASGDGRRFIAQMADRTAQVFDVETGRLAGPPIRPADDEWQAAVSKEISESKPAVALSTDGRLALTTLEQAVHVWETATGLPVGPPLQAHATIQRVLLGDPNTVMAFTVSDGVHVWDLSSGSTSDGELRELAGLLSGRRIGSDGGVASLPADDATRSAWSQLYGRQTELPKEAAEPELDWHRRKAQEFESAGDFFAAAVHLDPLVASAPDDVDLRRRRAEAEAEIGRWAAAAADFAVVVNHEPANMEAAISLAVLSARLGDRETYRSTCSSRIPSIRRFRPSADVIALFQAATLQPGGLKKPEALVKLLEPTAKFFSSDPGFCSALAFARFRASRFEAALEAAITSLKAYARGGVLGQGMQLGSKDVTPDRASGTPREWLLMALIEAKLGLRDVAIAWRDKAVRWLERATADRTDPDVLGGMSSALDRMQLQQWRKGLATAGVRLDYNTTRRYQPTWRQLLELELLRNEVDGAIGRQAGRSESRLP
jgi:WD40 repeat protein/tetratricopeptide (TPR) repeat protein